MTTHLSGSPIIQKDKTALPAARQRCLRQDSVACGKTALPTARQRCLRQDSVAFGKLVGAVTHVLVNDPTVGYGIFIENMLNAAQMPMAKAS